MPYIKIFRRETTLCGYSVKATDAEIEKLKDSNTSTTEAHELCQELHERAGWPESSSDIPEDACDWDSFEDEEYRFYDFED